MAVSQRNVRAVVASHAEAIEALGPLLAVLNTQLHEQKEEAHQEYRNLWDVIKDHDRQIAAALTAMSAHRHMTFWQRLRWLVRGS